MDSAQPNRWRFATAAIIMQVCLGIIYAWAVFRLPLEKAYGWSKAESIAPYRWSTLFFTLAMIAAGFWQDRKGPRLVGSVGGLLLAVGCLLAAYAGDTPTGLVLAYGVVAGLGVGFAYVTPIATCVKWFPDRRGLVVGLTVMGFGIGSLIFAPLVERLIGSDVSAFRETIPRTFLILAGIFLVLVTGAAQVYRVPPPGWKPQGWTPPVARSGKSDYTTGEMLGTWQFYAIWVTYFLGAAVGLTAIGEAAPLVRTAAAGAALSGGAALGVMSVFNGGGRLAWGALSDRIGRVPAMAAMSAILALSCGFLLRGGPQFWTLLAGLCLIGLCYGGFLAIMPSITADYYGARSVGANYGMLFTAWGAAGFAAPGYFTGVVSQSGYDAMFTGLTALGAAGVAVSFLCRRPGISLK